MSVTIKAGGQAYSGRQYGPVDMTYVVSADEAAELDQAAALIDADAHLEPERYVRQAARLAPHVPELLADRLRDFAEWGTDTGALVIRGLPIGPVPATPLDNGSGVGARTRLAAVCAVIGANLGDQLAYQAEGHGHLWQDMVPNPALAETQQSQSSKVVLEAHTEQAFSDLRPDYILLGCLRGDPAAETHLFSATELVGRLTRAEEAMLRRPLWTTSIDESFRPYVPHPEEVRGPSPILGGSSDRPTLLVDQDLMHGVTADAQRLLGKVVSLYEAHRRTHVLVSGDLLILDNLAAMHGRSAYRPRFDGGDRFIVRGFLTRDLRRSAYARTGRVIRAEHS